MTGIDSQQTIPCKSNSHATPMRTTDKRSSASETMLLAPGELEAELNLNSRTNSSLVNCPQTEGDKFQLLHNKGLHWSTMQSKVNRP
ncbi:hypothetical protein T4B_2645 [Trichinella pseudospiralis]|uniref:Uncharacterized protein n=2 Tax=Trichinella pseudospiralis TaxID=6337 RepID=A0A0V1FHZ1_TRIPS|nr:hypothetical protein T4E_3506 [Trichinella pseudospiralis]KRY74528.1 hypothetical protein T4A_1891 [Trichinella pseudospiralis]KRY85570.1 hypothetical protein T4D_5750 [Trichinella pseudospiralis]KRZ23716.1 hypothetical protein T4B_2645 [Trichinella pseudospiralis]KRZ39786.1 hypothetical protein T4C_5668 [Trichinella pseudospiralis]